MNKKVVKGARNELSLVKANVEAYMERSGDGLTLGVAQYSANKLMNLLIFIELNEAAQVATSICVVITNNVDKTCMFGDEQWSVLIEALAGLDSSLENCVKAPDSSRQSLECPRLAMASLMAPDTDLESSDSGSGSAVLDEPGSLLLEPAMDLAELPTLELVEEENELDNIDPEILEIFHEEADEELGSIQAQYALWKQDPTNKEAIDTVRRSFHTLKGSGNVVGAFRLGGFSASGEALFGRIVMGQLTHSAGLLVLLDEFVATMAHMIEGLFSGNPLSSEIIEAIEARAVSFPHEIEPASITISEPVSAPAPTQIESVVDSQTEVEYTEELDGMEDSLYNIFVPEVGLHIDTILTFIGHARAIPQTVTEEFVTAVHTLHGCSHLAGADAMATLSGAMERYCKSLFKMAIVCDVDMLQLFDRYSETMRDSVRAINTPETEAPEWQSLFEEIDWTDQALAGTVSAEEFAFDSAEPQNSLSIDTSSFMTSAVGRMTTLHDCFSAWKTAPDGSSASDGFATELGQFRSDAEAAKFPGMAKLIAVMESSLKTAPDPVDNIVGVIDAGMDSLEGILDNLYIGQTLPALEEITEKLQLELDRFSDQESEEGIEAEAAIEQDRLDEPLSASEEIEDLSFLDSISLDKIETPDPELLSLFLEEAGELVHQFEDAHSAWLVDTTSSDAMNAQLRHLHTLKGNALLANLYSLGGLSHYLESLFEMLISGQQASNEDLLNLIRVAFDGIQQSVESLNKNHPLPDLKLLTHAVKAAVLGQDWSDLLNTIDTDKPTLVENQPEPVLEAEPVVDEPVAEQQLVRQKIPPLLYAEREVGDEQRIRVLSSVLDKLVNDAGEISITQTHLEIQNGKDRYNLLELKTTIGRLQRQLGTLNVETEAQIISRHQGEKLEHDDATFDPLEMDRYSTLQQITRSIAETVSDLSEIGDILDKSSDDSDSLMLKVSLAARDLRDGLLKTLMVPLKQQKARFQRVVRMAAQAEGKEVELEMVGFDGEIERNLLEKIVAPIEHILRNAVAHGIESPDLRDEAKPRQGKIQLSFVQEFSNMEIVISDDGAGMDGELIRASAIERGLLEADAEISEEELHQLILVPGFSTADKVSLIAGRGVGMDVVRDGIQQLGGSITIASERGKGSTFTIRLPAMQSLIEALMIEVAGEIYALPHGSVDSVVKVRADTILPNYETDKPTLEHEGKVYELNYLGSMLGLSVPPSGAGVVGEVPVLLAQIGERAVAVQVDYLIGTSKIQSIPIGDQFKNYPWFVNSTLLSSGQVALLLNVKALISSGHVEQEHETLDAVVEKTPEIMIVDDSITLRKITSRIFEREGMNIVTAKDGVEALAMLQEYTPDVMLLDVEMPRMNGYELAHQMKNHSRLKNVPIIMITSRTGKKHVQKGMELGVKYYLGKPFHEPELLECVHTLLEEDAND
ncbi:MAG: response regulator [Pseudomonadales bacterium]|nr:response regulator [Pseudomonadales bacterium]